MNPEGRQIWVALGVAAPPCGQAPNDQSVFGKRSGAAWPRVRTVSIGTKPSGPGVRLSVLTVGYGACDSAVNQPLDRLSVVVGACVTSSLRTMPVTGEPSGLRATGTFSSIRPLPGSTSACQPNHTIVQPCRCRKPSPGSARALVCVTFGGTSALNSPSAPLLPRFRMFSSCIRLPFVGSAGRSTSRSVTYSTRPAALRGARPMSWIDALAGAVGSSSPCARAMTRS